MSDIVDFDLLLGKEHKERKRRGPIARILRWLLVSALLLVCVHLGLSMWLPAQVKQAGARLGLHLQFEDLSVSLLSGHVTFKDLRLNPVGAAQAASPMLEVPSAGCQVNLLSLLRGEWHLGDVWLMDAQVHLRQDAHGNWDLARLRSQLADATQSPWRHGFQIETLEAQSLQLTLHGQNRPALQGQLHVQALSIGAGHGSSHWELKGHSPDWLGSMELSWDRTITGSNGRLALTELRAAALEPWLNALGWADKSPKHDLDLNWVYEQAPPDEPDAPATLTLTDTRLKSDGVQGVQFEQLTLAIDDFSVAGLQAANLQIDGLALRVKRDRGNQLSVAGVSRLAEAEDCKAFSVSLGTVTIPDAKLHWVDRMMQPTLHLHTEVRAQFKAVDWNHTTGLGPFRIDLTLAGDELCESLIAVGTVQPQVPGSCDIQLKGDGLNARALQPYWDRIGIESQLVGASLDAHLRVNWQPASDGLETAFAFRDIYWRNGSDTSHLNELQARYLSRDSGPGLLSDLRARGGQLKIQRDGAGVISALGFALIHGSNKGMPFDLQGVEVLDTGVSLLDLYARDQALQQQIQVLEGHLAHWDSTRSAQTIGEPTTWRMHAELPGVAQTFHVGGSYARASQTTQAQFRFEGLQEGPLTQWLTHQGIDSDWEGGRLSFAAQATGRRKGSAWAGQLSVSDLEFQRGPMPWLSFKDLTLEGLRIPFVAPLQGLRFETLDLTAPTFSVTHMPNGQWFAGGLTWGAAQQDDSNSPAKAQLPWRELTPAIARLEAVGSGRFTVRDADLSLREERLDPSMETRWLVDVRAADRARVDLGPDYEVQYDRFWSAQINPIAGTSEWAISGQHHSGPESTSWQAQLTASGVDLGALTPYLPAGWSGNMEDAHLETRWKGEISAHPAGGWAFELESDGFMLRQTQAPAPALAFAHLGLSVPRLDPAQRTFKFGPLVCEELQMEWLRTHAGEYQGCGVRLDSSAAHSLSKTVAAWLREFDPSQPGDTPDLRLGPIDIGLQRLAIVDESLPQVRSALAHGRLELQGPFRWAADANGAAAPLTMGLRGGVDSMIGEFSLDLLATPFSASPSMEFDFSAEGLQGRRLAPWIPKWLGASAETDLRGGRLVARAALDLQLPDGEQAWSRAWREGFGAFLTVQDFQLLENPIAEPLLAFEQLQVRAPHVDLTRAQAQVELVQWMQPQVRSWRDAHGWHLAGLTWKTQPDLMRFEDFDLTVADLQVHGLQLDYEDRKVSPAWHFPVQQGRLELQDFTSQLRKPAAPMRLHASARGGQVRLPLREPDTLEALLRMESGSAPASDGSQATESRRAFETLEITGRGGGDGFLQIEGTAFELATLRGYAKTMGLQIQDGLLDLKHVLRLQPDGGLTWQSQHRMELLDVEETRPGAFTGPHGWACDLSTFLQSLRDGEGQQGLTMGMTLQGPQPTAQRFRQGLESSLQKASQQSPAQVRGQSLRSPAGTKSLQGLSIDFAPASAVLTARARKDLARWIATPRKAPDSIPVLSHSFGTQDLARAAILGTPPTAALENLLIKLRQQKQRLASEYRSASHSFASGPDPNSKAQQTHKILTRISQQQAAAEQALDHTLRLLTPGAERRQNRRTRASALSLAQLRQEAVQAFLTSHGYPTSASPVQNRPPQFTHRHAGAGGRLLLR